MFSTLGLLQSVPCPRQSDCARCPFSHAPVPARAPEIAAPLVVPAKRPLEFVQPATFTAEPPIQRIKTTSAPKHLPLPLPAPSTSSVRAPLPPLHPLILLPHSPACPPSESMPHSRTSPFRSDRSVPSPRPHPFADRPHRPCSRTSMITLSSCTNTSCPQTQPSLPSMPSAKKNRCTKSPQSSPIAMCALTTLPLSPLSSSPFPGSHKLDRFPKETRHPYLRVPSLCRHRCRYRNSCRGTQRTRRSSSHPFCSRPPSRVHRYHATIGLCNRNATWRGRITATRRRSDHKMRPLCSALYGHKHPHPR